MDRILAIAQVEDRTNLDKQIAKQTLQPDRIIYYIDDNPASGVIERRKRIAKNHIKLQEIVKAYKPDLVWQVEQDGDYPEDALQQLYMDYQILKGDDFGYISGIQVGRHGLYCLGAWVDFTDTTFNSLDHTLTGIQEVEATGFYCLLAERETWLSGKADWNGEPYGPDVVWSRGIDKKKYCNMDIQVGHIIKNGIIRPEHTSTCSVQFYKDNTVWRYKQLD